MASPISVSDGEIGSKMGKIQLEYNGLFGIRVSTSMLYNMYMYVALYYLYRESFTAYPSICIDFCDMTLLY